MINWTIGFNYEIIPVSPDFKRVNDTSELLETPISMFPETNLYLRDDVFKVRR